MDTSSKICVVLGIKINKDKAFELLGIEHCDEFKHDILSLLISHDFEYIYIGKKFAGPSESYPVELRSNDIVNSVGSVWHELMRLGLLKALDGQWEISLNIVKGLCFDGK